LKLGDIKRYNVSTDSTYKFEVFAPSAADGDTLSGFIFQAHSQYQTLYISNSLNFLYDQTAIGSDVGLWREITSDDLTFYLKISMDFNSTTAQNISILVAVTTIENESPIPGACNLVSAIETDPNLQIGFTQYTTNVTFQDGNLGYNASSNSPILQCTQQIHKEYAFKQLSYVIYRLLVSSGDYNVDILFDKLEQIIKGSFDTIESLPHVSKDAGKVKTITFDTFEGDSTIYVVKVTSLINGRSSLYVPVTTYACSFDASGTCSIPVSLADMIISPIIGLFGFFLCLAAHRLFHFEVVIFTWIIMTLALYMLIFALLPVSHEVLVSLSAVGGIIISLLLFVFWFFTGWYLPFVFLFVASAGFLLTAVLFFTPFSTITALWTINYIYALFFICVMVLLLIPAVIFPRPMNIFASSIVGGYLVIYCIGAFVSTSLDEIVLRVVKIVAFSDYLSTSEAFTFQFNDIILSAVWVSLLVIGLIIQSLLAIKRDPFPKSLYKQLKNKCNKKRERSLSEQRRLLQACSSNESLATVYYGAINEYK
jgi:hypothetical protein